MQDELSLKLLKHNQQVPRYTSFPTANHFSETVKSSAATRWLGALSEETPLSLYFHIPFCKEICWYCGCHTKASKQYQPVTDFLAYMKKEVSLVAKLLKTSRKVTHIHFGGGSPSYLSPEDFAGLMDHVSTCFNVQKGAEIAIEIDPRELTELKVAAYRKAGVTRASLGVQDFHKDVQHSINRLQPVHTIYKAVQTLRDYQISQINMDLLYGLPMQTVASIERNIDMALGLNPSRISLFGYAHVPWMKKHMRLIDEATLPNGRDRLNQFSAAAKSLVHKGYVQIGLDHFVKPNDPMATALQAHTLTRNFQGYSTDSAPVMIGFGPSAISDLPQGYTQNTLANHSYFESLDANRLPTAKGVPITSNDQTIRRLIAQLMCYMEIDIDKFAASEGLLPGYFSYAYEALEPLAQDKLISFENGKICVASEVPQAVRLVCAAFDPYLNVSAQKHAQIA